MLTIEIELFSLDTPLEDLASVVELARNRGNRIAELAVMMAIAARVCPPCSPGCVMALPGREPFVNLGAFGEIGAVMGAAPLPPSSEPVVRDVLRRLGAAPGEWEMLPDMLHVMRTWVAHVGCVRAMALEVQRTSSDAFLSDGDWADA